ncbi:T9SS type A sorting domain-containing protein [Flavobacterium soli]|uniref:T9SS type A sorting domain-containing protein n=1 Tax=Flavobacterium soli TaxID=344881 RepID=UPI00041AC8EE|nr:T9SS type A sorting domain-containing protein [Flavobacterium soli]
MKRKLLLVFCMFASALSFAQTKSTGEVNLSTNVKATLELNNTTTTAKLTLVGPNDRWFALQFGSFSNGQGMMLGTDMVYWNNTTLVDCVQQGEGQVPDEDTNNWTFVSNTNNSPSTGLRTIVFTRPFNTGDANDFVFNYNATTIDFAWARRSNAGYTINNHGANRGYVINAPFTVLGVEDFSLNASAVYPNPSKGNFTVTSKTTLETISIYTQTGAFVKTITVGAGATEVEVDAEGLAQGVYLLELQNASEKSWKKIIIN